MNRISIGLFTAALILAASLGSAPPVFAQAAPPAAGASATPATESGLAAVYSSKLDGHRTASGQRYNPTKLTAAHKTLPFGTKVKVTNTKNGKSVIVQINDRGPKQAGRVLDITPRAAHALGIRRLAMAEVSVEVQN